VEEVDAQGMLIMAIAGIVFNGLAVLRLKKDKSLNSKVVFMHLLEDVLGWIAILIVSIIMLFVDLPILDPILSIVIAVFVLSRIVPTFLKIGKIFMQYKPEDLELKQIQQDLESIKEIDSIHDIHLWSLDGNNHIFSCHVIVKSNPTVQELSKIKANMKQRLEALGVSHSTLEFESSNEQCVSC
jgi:cobalt-zinc-cadmium efflux system protein